jgi:2'-5' RNA ligase
MSLFPDLVAKELGRYYIAIIPPEPHLGELWQMKEYIAGKYGVKGGLFSPPHITLTDDFYLEARYENELKERLKSVAARHKSFPFHLNGFMKMGPKAIAISHGKIDELKALREDIRNTMNLFLAEMRVPVKFTPKFAPHLTIAYRGYNDGSLEQAWDEEYKDRFFEKSFPIYHVTVLKHNGKTWDDWDKILLDMSV